MTHLSATLGNLQIIIDGIPNSIFVKDRAHRLVLLPSACLFFGHSRETLLTRPDSELFPSEQIKLFHDTDDLAFQSGEESENEEQVTDANGRIRHVITRKRRAVMAMGATLKVQHALDPTLTHYA